MSMLLFIGIFITVFIISFQIGTYVKLVRDGNEDISKPIHFVTYNPWEVHGLPNHKGSTGQVVENRSLQKKFDQGNLLMKVLRKEYQFNPIQFQEGEVLQRNMTKRVRFTDSIAMNRNDKYQRLMAVLGILRQRVSYIRQDAFSPKKSRSSINALETADTSNNRLDPTNSKLFRLYKQLKSMK